MSRIDLTPSHVAHDIIGCGTNIYVAWCEDSFSPRLVLVLADSWGEAYDEYVCSDEVRSYVLTEDDELADYIDGWDSHDSATLSDVWDAYSEGRVSGVTVNDNGDLVYSEMVRCCALADFQQVHAPRG